VAHVSIVRVVNDNCRKAVYKALDYIKITPRSVDTALIKPNLCHYYSADTGITTDVCVVDCLIDYIRERINSDARIIIGEADATEMKADTAFKLLGYSRLARTKGISLMNLSKDKKIRVDGRYVKEIPAITKEADLFFTVPKLKTHTDTKITCCLKNQFGAIPYWKKAKFHKNLNETIVEAVAFMKPHICLVDGIIALEGMGPISNGKPLRMNLIVAGNDPVATDHVCSKIMGISNVKHVKLAQRNGVGSIKDLHILGERVDNVKRKFKSIPPTLRLASYCTRFDLGSLAFILERLSRYK